jgi:Na+-driven multidrug efflux pump
MTEGIPVVRIVALAMVLMSVATVWLHAVTGTGNSRVTLLIEAVTIILYCIYVYLVLEVYNLNMVWGWMSEILYWLSMFVLSFFYIKSGQWKDKVI